MNKLKKQTRGITLVALVVTIIVLLILAGVAISLTIGNNGLFSRSKTIADVHSKETSIEKLEIALSNLELGKNTNA